MEVLSYLFVDVLKEPAHKTRIEDQPCVCPWNWTTTKNCGRWCFQPNLKNITYSAIVNSFPTIWLNYMKWYYNSIVIPISELREIFLYSHLGWPTGGLITKIYPENKGKHKTYLKPPTIWDLYGHPRHSSQTFSGGTEVKRVKNIKQTQNFVAWIYAPTV